jgi:DNA (cytosine-5)-methyltransferase 1
MNELSLFTGAGGGLLGSRLLGWETICAVEIDDYCRRVILQRQADGCLDRFPIWDDVKTFDGRPWRGLVDIVTGGFPCQDISAAGKGAGIEGSRSGLWSEMARIIGEVRPRFAFVENSPMLTVRGLGRVLGDLAEMGFDAEWGCVSAASQGAPHIRDRIWLLGYNSDSEHGQERCTVGKICKGATTPADRNRSEQDTPDPQSIRRGKGGAGRPAGDGSGLSDETCGDIGNTHGTRLEKRQGEPGDNGTQQPAAIERNRATEIAVGASWWESEPALGRVADGVASRVDRLRAIGNGQVPAVVRAAWELLTGG